MTDKIDNIHKARIKLLCNNPFFGDIAFRLRLEPRENFGRIGTDGTSIVYDPKAFDSFSHGETQASVARDFNISKGRISQIVNKKSWTNV